MASSAVIVESLASTMFIPLTTSIVALAFVSGDGISALPYGITWLLIAGTAIISFMYLRHAYPARTA
ncbi:hypothetical protein ACRQGT_09315 [Actinotignum sp. GS-2025c]